MKTIPTGTEMRKIMSLLALSLPVMLFTGFLSPPDISLKVNDLEKRKLKGSVRSVMITDYFIKNDDISGTKDTIITQEQTFFDLDGQIYEVVNYKNGIAFTVSKYLFDSVGKQLLCKEYDREGTLNLVITYKFNDKGHRIKAEYDWPDYHPEDDDFGFEVEDKHPYSTIIYKNDYRGYCTEEKRFRESGDLYCRCVYDYDFKGNMVEMNYFNSDDRHTWRKVHKYDMRNLLKQTRTYKDNRIVLRSDFSYEFDEMGNWIRKIERRHLYHNIYSSFFDKGDKITNRKIEYYPQL